MSDDLDIRHLVPHDSPMILLDGIEEVHDNGLTASVVINEHSLFADSKGVPAWVGIEYMGQAIAAYAGICARRNGEPLRIGFLVGTRSYKPDCNYFPLNEKLTVSVEDVTESAVGLQVFSCTIKGKGIEVGANLNVYIPENVEEFMREEQR